MIARILEVLDADSVASRSIISFMGLRVKAHTGLRAVLRMAFSHTYFLISVVNWVLSSVAVIISAIWQANGSPWAVRAPM